MQLLFCLLVLGSYCSNTSFDIAERLMTCKVVEERLLYEAKVQMKSVWGQNYANEVLLFWRWLGGWKMKMLLLTRRVRIWFIKTITTITISTADRLTLRQLPISSVLYTATSASMELVAGISFIIHSLIGIWLCTSSNRASLSFRNYWNIVLFLLGNFAMWSLQWRLRNSDRSRVEIYQLNTHIKEASQKLPGITSTTSIISITSTTSFIPTPISSAFRHRRSPSVSR